MYFGLASLAIEKENLKKFVHASMTSVTNRDDDNDLSLMSV